MSIFILHNHYHRIRYYPAFKLPYQFSCSQNLTRSHTLPGTACAMISAGISPERSEM